jgi:hypothetical protein
MMSMVAEYKLDGNANDTWGTHTAGTISGASTYSSCLQSTCYSFDGADDYIELADASDLRMTTGGTISVWIYPKSQGEGAGRIIDKSVDTSGTNGYIVYIGSNNIYFLINAGAYIGFGATYNQWQLITITFVSGSRKLYINGVKVSEDGVAGLPPNVAGAVTIGNRAGNTDRTFDGLIDEVRIFDAAIPTSQIQQNYFAGLNKLFAKKQITQSDYQQRIASLRQSVGVGE